MKEKIEEYMDKAFNSEDLNKRERYREAIREIEHLLLLASELEK